jgi:benzodiazapine receptor
MKQKNKINWKVLILCFFVVSLVAFIGSRFTKIDSWYDSVKPSITPPNYVFPIAWTILFILIALSLYFAWINSGKNEKKLVAGLFLINFVLNVLWSISYFTMHKPLLAFFDLLLLFASILALIIYNWKIDKKASYLLMPYLLWVCFAGILNYLSI